jgi:ATP-dependent DNA ligase
VRRGCWDVWPAGRSAFLHRGRRLEDLELTAPLTTSVQTDDRDVAETWLAQAWSLGLEGVVAKEVGLRYRGGVRAVVKVKPSRT